MCVGASLNMLNGHSLQRPIKVFASIALYFVIGGHHFNFLSQTYVVSPG